MHGHGRRSGLILMIPTPPPPAHHPPLPLGRLLVRDPGGLCKQISMRLNLSWRGVFGAFGSSLAGVVNGGLRGTDSPRPWEDCPRYTVECITTLANHSRSRREVQQPLPSQVRAGQCTGWSGCKRREGHGHGATNVTRAPRHNSRRGSLFTYCPLTTILELVSGGSHTTSL